MCKPVLYITCYHLQNGLTCGIACGWGLSEMTFIASLSQDSNLQLSKLWETGQINEQVKAIKRLVETHTCETFGGETEHKLNKRHLQYLQT